MDSAPTTAFSLIRCEEGFENVLLGVRAIACYEPSTNEAARHIPRVLRNEEKLATATQGLNQGLEAAKRVYNTAPTFPENHKSRTSREQFFKDLELAKLNKAERGQELAESQLALYDVLCPDLHVIVETQKDLIDTYKDSRVIEDKLRIAKSKLGVEVCAETLSEDRIL